MKLAVVKVVNGAFAIVSEWTDDEQGAIVAFHDACKNHWSAQDVVSATISILDENLIVFKSYSEHITHSAEPQPTQPTQPTEGE